MPRMKQILQTPLGWLLYSLTNGLKPLTIIPKHSILDVAAALDPPLIRNNFENLEEVVSSHVDILVIACRDKDR